MLNKKKKLIISQVLGLLNNLFSAAVWVVKSGPIFLIVYTFMPVELRIVEEVRTVMIS